MLDSEFLSLPEFESSSCVTQHFVQLVIFSGYSGCLLSFIGKWSGSTDRLQIHVDFISV